MKKTLSLSLIATLLSASLFAQAVQNVNVYTYNSFASEKWGAGGKLRTLFESQMPQCRIQYMPTEGANAMFNRLRLEGKQTQADMVIGLNNYMLDGAEKSGLFAEHKLKANLPEHFKNATFIPYGFTPYAFIYDKTQLQNPPKTLAELFERQDLKVIYQDPRTSSVGQGMMAWVNHVFSAEEINTRWQQLAKHTVTVSKGWSESYGAFLKGEADIVLSYDTSPLYHILNENTDKYQALPLTDNKVTQVEFAALVKSRPNACANEFLAFLLTPEAQKILSEANIMLPIADKTGLKLFDEMKQKALAEKVAMPVPSQQQMKKWINQWQQALSE